MVMASTGRRRCRGWAPDGRMAAAWSHDGTTIVADILSVRDRDAIMWDAGVRHTNGVEVVVPSEMLDFVEWEVRRQSFRKVSVRRVSTTLRRGLPQRRALVYDDDAP